jgi:hypothetical protein
MDWRLRHLETQPYLRGVSFARKPYRAPRPACHASSSSAKRWRGKMLLRFERAGGRDSASWTKTPLIDAIEARPKASDYDRSVAAPG